METFKLISAQERKESLEVLATWKACQKNKDEPSDEVTIITYAFHYVPLVMFVLSILMLVLLNEGVFEFCSSEIVSDRLQALTFFVPYNSKVIDVGIDL